MIKTFIVGYSRLVEGTGSIIQMNEDLDVRLAALRLLIDREYCRDRPKPFSMSFTRPKLEVMSMLCVFSGH